MRQLYFIRHSSFLYIGECSMCLFDFWGFPSKDQAANLADLLAVMEKYRDKRLYIFCTHSHSDHYSPIVHTLFGNHPGGTVYIFHEELRESTPIEYQDQVIFLDTYAVFQDDILKVKAYGSTDLGGSFYIEEAGFTLFHAGDLNNWHWNEEASEEYVAQYESEWHKELSVIADDRMRADLVMFPTDLRLGRDYLKGLEEFLEVVPTKFLAPMHLNGKISDRQGLYLVAEHHHLTLLLPLVMKAQLIDNECYE